MTDTFRYQTKKFPMAHKKHGTGLLIMIVVTILWAGAMAQSVQLYNVIINMSPCLNNITKNSSSPSSGWCTHIANVVSTKPQCLCEVLKGGGSSMGLNINQTQAAVLPGACKVQTPPVSECNGTPKSNHGTNTEPLLNTVPSTDSGSSDAGSTKLAVPLVFFLLFASSG